MRIPMVQLSVGETVMRTARESNAPLLAAVAISNFIFKSITEALYALSIRRALRAIERFG
jgi:hypothetical protein